MVRTRKQLTVWTLAAGLLAPAPAVPQEPATTERDAFAAVVRAGEAVGRARDAYALFQVAGRAVAAAEQAAGAFIEADRARDAALVAYRAAYREALAGAVTCDNGYPCTNDRVDPFEGFTTAFAVHFELIAAVSAANAVYVDAVGVPGADAARARAARIRGLAARMRAPGAIDDPARWNALVGSVGSEIDAGNVLHRHATAERQAADRALVEDVTRVMDALDTAANRSVQRNRGAAAADGAAGVDGDTDPVAFGRTGARGVSDAVLRATLDAAQDAMESLRSRIVAAATSVPDLASSGSAETTVPRDDDAPGADTAALEPEPADDVAGWVNALTEAARAAEQAAADAEAAAGGQGSSSSRASSCTDAEARVTAAATRVTSLTIGDDRPRDVSARIGRETYSDLFDLLDAAQRRARAACSSIEQPR